MKVLYAIQGTGNGHTTRALEFVPELAKHVDLDVLISGNQYDIDFHFPIKYRLRGMSFVFGKKGGIDYWDTFKNLRLFQFLKEIRTLPVHEYDLVISDFEPVTSWACRLRKVPLVGCSHQYSFTHSDVPRPEKGDFIGELVMKYYAPAKQGIGIHFKNYTANIVPPIIRKELREATPVDENFYVMYLPSYSDENILKVLQLFPNENWKVFSKHTDRAYTEANVQFFPPSNELFMESINRCTGVICGAGFETPAEALFLKKKLLVIPMTNQIEQQFNAAALEELNVPVLPTFDVTHEKTIGEWLENPQNIELEFSGNSEELLHSIMQMQCL